MFEKISKELLEKAMQAGTKDEALAILKEGGVELTDEDLKNISAGEEGDDKICWRHIPCPAAESEGGEDGAGTCWRNCRHYCTPLWI